MSSPTTTADLAERHEALHLRPSALLRQVEAIAARRPGEPLPDSIRTTAEDLLFEAKPFRPRSRRELPPAAPDYGGLAVQLGQVLAALGAWEARHSIWSAAVRTFVWHLADGETQPVRRLLSPSRLGAPPPGKPEPQEDMVALRRKLAARIDQLRRTDPPPGPAAPAVAETYPRISRPS